MIRIFEFDALKPEEILNRDIRAEASVEATVDAIIADVRARGDAALKDYALKFDTLYPIFNGLTIGENRVWSDEWVKK